MDAPETIHQRIWAELHAATGTPGHAWRTPVLATVAHDGTPDARTVVLRMADAATRRLAVFTDVRSPKVAQLRAQPRAVLVFWCPVLRWQVRATVQFDLIERGERVDAIWSGIAGTSAAGDYLSADAPGTAGGEAGRQDDHHHLCIADAEVLRMDWLALSRQGHRRLAFTSDGVVGLVP